ATSPLPRVSRATIRPPPLPTPFPYTTLFRSEWLDLDRRIRQLTPLLEHQEEAYQRFQRSVGYLELRMYREAKEQLDAIIRAVPRSEEHTSELQSRENLVCRLLLEKKKRMSVV